MNRSLTEARARGSARPWHIPPPLVHGRSSLEAGAILEEIQGELGLLLWEIARDVLLWTRAGADTRSHLFAAGALSRRSSMIAAIRPPPELREPIATLGAILRAPGADQAAIAEACRTISHWAEKQGAGMTALTYAQNRALVNPDAPGPALAVAKLAERLGEHARAELWYRRAIGIARRARAWRAYSRSFSGLGRLYHLRGNLPAARRFHLRALRGARRGGLAEERGVALHDLFGMEVESGRSGVARHHALEALEAYPRRSPRLPALAHDVAYLWMEEGEFARAATVFQAVLPLVRRPEERLWVEADLMRAAAGAGDEPLAQRLAERLARAAARPEMSAAAARALLEVARGQLQLRRWEAAEAAASAALTYAEERHEGRITLAAEAVLQAVRSGRAAGLAQSKARGRGRVAARAADESLAEALVRSLEALREPGREEKETETSKEITVNALPRAESDRR